MHALGSFVLMLRIGRRRKIDVRKKACAMNVGCWGHCTKSFTLETKVKRGWAKFELHFLQIHCKCMHGWEKQSRKKFTYTSLLFFFYPF